MEKPEFCCSRFAIWIIIYEMLIYSWSTAPGSRLVIGIYVYIFPHTAYIEREREQSRISPNRRNWTEMQVHKNPEKRSIFWFIKNVIWKKTHNNNIITSYLKIDKIAKNRLKTCFDRSFFSLETKTRRRIYIFFEELLKVVSKRWNEKLNFLHTSSKISTFEFSSCLRSAVDW